MRTLLQKASLFCAVMLNLVFIGEILAQTTGPPDAFGYRWRNSNDAEGPEAKWFDLSDTEKYDGVLDFSDKFDDDNFFGPLNFSFDFPFYWYTRNELYIGSNGYVAFNPQNISASFPPIPNIGGKGDDYLAPFLADLTGGGDINAAKFLFWTNFKDTVIVSFEEVPWFNPGGGPTGSNTFQVVLSKVDSSVTFNYAGQSGGPSNSQTSDFLSIGIENVSGRVGVQQSRDLDAIQQFPIGMSKTNPYSIKFFHPGSSSTYTTKDLRVLWNSRPGTQGVFAAKGGEDRDALTNILNQGLETGPKSVLTGEVKRNGQLVNEVSTFTRVVEPGEEDLFKFNGLKIPLDETGVVTFKSTITYDDDDVKSNNTVTHMTTVVDTTADEVELRHDDKTRNGGVAFVGAQNFSAGLGTYIEPPYYPVKVKAITVNLSGAAGGTPPGGPARVEMYDDDGLNLAGERDNSPGTLLYQFDIQAGAAGENRVDLPEPVQINSGGVYLAALQGATTVYIGYDNTAPTSYNAFEVINGEFVPFRDRNTEDAMIGIVIEKGDETQVQDLAITKLISPDSSVDYTEEVPVTVELTNLAGIDITGPFEISYRVNSRVEVFDTIPESTTIAAGTSMEFTFDKPTPRPPAPKTRFDSVCVKTFLTNDFVPENDELCYYNANLPNSVDLEIAKFELYPNPASTNLNFSMELRNEANVQVSLIGFDGKEVIRKNYGLQQPGFKDLQLYLPDLPTGIYAYEVVAGNKVQRGKVAVTKR